MSDAKRAAFTLVELLVVVAIIVVIVAMLTPALESAVEQARRAKCAGNQHAIGIGLVDYATQNNGQIIPCTRRREMGFFSPPGGFPAGDDRSVDWLAALASVGLFETTKRQHVGFDGTTTFDHGPAPIWTDPSSTFFAGYFSNTPNASYPDNRMFLINYLYFGGVDKWSNRWYSNKESLSPVRLTTSRPGWVFAGDNMTIVDQLGGGSWNGPTNTFFSIPNHRASPKPWPEGGNYLTVDGGVRWRPIEDTVYLHCHSTRHVVLIAQDDTGGWTPPSQATGEYWKK